MALRSLPPLSLLLVLCAPPLAAQTAQVTGTVTDSVTRQPVEAADIVVLGTRFVASTGPDGRYILRAVPAGTYVIEARRIGYRATRTRVTLLADGELTLDLRLLATPFRLEEVVVTGAQGEMVGTLAPFTVDRLGAEDAPVRTANVVETIQGKIAGVTVVPEGQPGSGLSIQLRTPTSISRADFPLIVVDGVVLGTADSGSTADLDALDIERIEVVKGAAGASLYGSRAQSGVIQIWTRRGRDVTEGRTEMTLRSEVGTNALEHQIAWARYHHYRMNAGQTAYVNAAGRDTTRAGRVEETATGTGLRFQDNPFPGAFYDQVDAFFDPGSYYTNSLTLSQNAGSTNWFGSFTNHRSAGVIDGHGWYRRNDVRLNLDHRLRPDLSIALSGYYSRSVRDEMYENPNPFFDLINIAPDANLREPDPDGTPVAFQPDQFGIRPNPLYKLVTEESWTQRSRFLGSVALRYNPTAWLSVEANASLDHADRFAFFFLDRGLKSDANPTGGLGSVGRENDFSDAVNASLSVTLARSVGGLNGHTTVRALMEREDGWQSDAAGADLAVLGVPDLDNARTRSLSSAYNDLRTNAFFVITSADYRGKYVVDGLVRHDASSLFGPAERNHLYGRVSAAYRMAEEPWWPWPNITEFKLRFSRGTAGNRPNFADQFETYDINAAGTLTKDQLGNTELKPELATETEFGVDLIAFGRLSAQLTYARTKVEDQLLQIPLGSVYGYTSQWQNAGTVEGHTYEATLQAQLVSTPQLNLRLGFVLDRSRHEVTEFDRACFRISPFYRCEGEPLGVFYGHRFLRRSADLPARHAGSLNQFAVNNDGLLVAVGLDSAGAPVPYTAMRWGTNVTVDGVVYSWGMPIKVVDATGQPAIVRIGDSNPDLHFGVNSELRWKNFSVYGLVDMQIGGQVYNSTKQRMYQWYRSAEEDQTGKPENLKKPVDYYQLLYNGNDDVEWFVEPGGYVKLRELAVRYRLPVERLGGLRRLGIRSAHLSIIGRNLFTFTSYTGYDPEVGGAVGRDDDFVYPRFRTFTGSLLLEF